MDSAPTSPVRDRAPDSKAAVAWFADFAERSSWRFAKTYVESYPHEYTLDRWGDGDMFRQAILCIEQWGVTESFWSSRRKYLHVGERKYWHMGDVSSPVQEDQPSLINRTWIDVSRYRDEARALGHDGEALDRLEARWNMLLERARRGHKAQSARVRTGCGVYLCVLTTSSEILEAPPADCPST